MKISDRKELRREMKEIEESKFLESRGLMEMSSRGELRDEVNELEEEVANVRDKYRMLEGRYKALVDFTCAMLDIDNEKLMEHVVETILRFEEVVGEASDLVTLIPSYEWDLETFIEATKIAAIEQIEEEVEITEEISDFLHDLELHNGLHDWGKVKGEKDVSLYKNKLRMSIASEFSKYVRTGNMRNVYNIEEMVKEVQDMKEEAFDILEESKEVLTEIERQVDECDSLSKQYLTEIAAYLDELYQLRDSY